MHKRELWWFFPKQKSNKCRPVHSQFSHQKQVTFSEATNLQGGLESEALYEFSISHTQFEFDYSDGYANKIYTNMRVDCKGVCISWEATVAPLF